MSRRDEASRSSRDSPGRGLVLPALFVLLALALLLALLPVFTGPDSRPETGGGHAGGSAATPDPASPSIEESDPRAMSRFERLSQSANRSSAAPEQQGRRWRDSFPWKPTIDEEAPYIPSAYTNTRLLSLDESRIINEQAHNYQRLKRFFADDSRFSIQFERMYGILSEYGKTNSPVTVSGIFEALWSYHHSLDRGDEAQAQASEDMMATYLYSPAWNNDILSVSDQGREEAEEIVERLIGEIDGMQQLPMPWQSTDEEERIGMSYYQILRTGDPDLVGDYLQPYAGWTRQRWEWFAIQRSNAFRRFLDPAD